jgi:hypothetical protein
MNAELQEVASDLKTLSILHTAVISMVNDGVVVFELGTPQSKALITAGRRVAQLAIDNAALVKRQATLTASLKDAIRYIERVTAHRNLMTAAELEAEEEYVRNNVAFVSTGRTVGDSITFDLEAAREAVQETQ